VGATHAGTSWWDRLICAHAGVARLPDRPRGLHFFDERWQGGLDEAAVGRYRALCSRPPGAIAGEWTPSYLLGAWTPALLRHAAPEARILVLLRDPVARFRSERAPDDPHASPRATPRAAANAAFNRGLYADQLLRLWRVFPREQVLVLQYERCVADTRTELLRTYAFLGLPSVLPADVDPSPRSDEQPAPGKPLSGWQTQQLTRHYAPENERLGDLLPDLDLSLWQAP
jgi:hypothetical protein